MVINLVLTAFRNLKQKIKILLLDDILSHLDQKNRMLVMESINSNFLEDYVFEGIHLTFECLVDYLLEPNCLMLFDQ